MDVYMYMCTYRARYIHVEAERNSEKEGERERGKERGSEYRP